MKKVLNLLFIAIITSFVLSSCGGDDPIIDPDPIPTTLKFTFNEIGNQWVYESKTIIPGYSTDINYSTQTIENNFNDSLYMIKLIEIDSAATYIDTSYQIYSVTDEYFGTIDEDTMSNYTNFGYANAVIGQTWTSTIDGQAINFSTTAIDTTIIVEAGTFVCNKTKGISTDQLTQYDIFYSLEYGLIMISGTANFMGTAILFTEKLKSKNF